MLNTPLDPMRLDMRRYHSAEEELDLLGRAPRDTALQAPRHGSYLDGEADPRCNPYQRSPQGHDLNPITLYSCGPTGKPGGDAVGFLAAS